MSIAKPSTSYKVIRTTFQKLEIQNDTPNHWFIKLTATVLPAKEYKHFYSPLSKEEKRLFLERFSLCPAWKEHEGIIIGSIRKVIDNTSESRIDIELVIYSDEQAGNSVDYIRNVRYEVENELLRELSINMDYGLDPVTGAVVKLIPIEASLCYTGKFDVGPFLNVRASASQAVESSNMESAPAVSSQAPPQVQADQSQASLPSSQPQTPAQVQSQAQPQSQSQAATSQPAPQDPQQRATLLAQRLLNLNSKVNQPKVAPAASTPISAPPTSSPVPVPAAAVDPSVAAAVTAQQQAAAAAAAAAAAPSGSNPAAAPQIAQVPGEGRLQISYDEEGDMVIKTPENALETQLWSAYAEAITGQQDPGFFKELDPARREQIFAFVENGARERNELQESLETLSTHATAAFDHFDKINADALKSGLFEGATPELLKNLGENPALTFEKLVKNQIKLRDSLDRAIREIESGKQKLFKLSSGEKRKASAMESLELRANPSARFATGQGAPSNAFDFQKPTVNIRASARDQGEQGDIEAEQMLMSIPENLRNRLSPQAIETSIMLAKKRRYH